MGVNVVEQLAACVAGAANVPLALKMMGLMTSDEASLICSKVTYNTVPTTTFNDLLWETIVLPDLKFCSVNTLEVVE